MPGVVHDGLTAVKKIVELEPDVVILDLVLPKLTAWAYWNRWKNKG